MGDVRFDMSMIVVLVVALLVTILALARWAEPPNPQIVIALVAIVAALCSGLIAYLMRPPQPPKP